MDLLDVPDELSKLRPFVQRWSEIHEFEPAIGYWCLYWSLSLVLKNSSGLSDECRPYILHLMETCESLRAELDENENVKNDDSASAYVKAFALQTLVRAERNTKAGKPDVSIYLAAKDFISLNEVWGPLDEQLQKSLKLCKVRILQLVKGKTAAVRDDTDNVKALQPTEHKDASVQLNEEDTQRSTTNGAPHFNTSRPSSERDRISPTADLPEAGEKPANLESSHQPSETTSSSPIHSVPAAVSHPVAHVASTTPTNTENTRHKVSLAMTERIDQARRHSKFAYSALDYDDIETAISHLRSALSLLEEQQPDTN
ncbi:endosomal sorting protein [Schizosaccharomyces japonicus yFS275]|uniref:Endosomal sorting protein n=1 Tax=Schizosaccharomyces japonicus (strain yFS275 / FY16936) TaxID=402676 RepID=B6K5S1_SCHJY|nr:endosomal sorting protein [Schizosaccharomyces japonicus yFS275]EEB08875.1 endosomal sorting protein [Schizosaccharomyces japonicus yFS275]